MLDARARVAELRNKAAVQRSVINGSMHAGRLSGLGGGRFRRATSESVVVFSSLALNFCFGSRERASEREVSAGGERESDKVESCRAQSMARGRKKASSIGGGGARGSKWPGAQADRARPAICSLHLNQIARRRRRVLSLSSELTFEFGPHCASFHTRGGGGQSSFESENK